MKNDVLKTAYRSVKNWWIGLLIGILATVVGIWSLITPDTTLVALTVLFVVTFLVTGTLEIIFAISNRNMLHGWGWNLAAGILDLLLGIMLMVLPLPVITVILIYFVGFWILMRSIFGIGTASELSRMKVKGWGWLLAMAILGILFSFLFFISPVFGGGFLVIFVGIAFITYGISRIYLAFRLRSAKVTFRKIRDEFREMQEEIREELS